MLKHKLVDFLIQFLEEVDKEISEMKLFVSFLYMPNAAFPTLTNGAVKCKSEIRSGILLDSSKPWLALPCSSSPPADLISLCSSTEGICAAPASNRWIESTYQSSLDSSYHVWRLGGKSILFLDAINLGCPRLWPVTMARYVRV